MQFVNDTDAMIYKLIAIKPFQPWFYTLQVWCIWGKKVS